MCSGTRQVAEQSRNLEDNKVEAKTNRINVYFERAFCIKTQEREQKTRGMYRERLEETTILIARGTESGDERLQRPPPSQENNFCK